MRVVDEIKRKREFSELQNSIVERVSKITKGDIKKSRALLRKCFGVFLTNRVLKRKISDDKMLLVHISSRKRNYAEFYRKIFLDIKSVGSVIDLGCGVNGFSYNYLKKELGEINYIGVEAVGQLVEQMNKYFRSNEFLAKAIVGDLFDIDLVLKILKNAKKLRVVFLFQVIDALENLERNFSKKFILEVSKECEFIVISLPTESLGGRKKFAVRRKWLLDFLEENLVIEKDFLLNGERVLIIGNKKNLFPKSHND